MSSQETEMGARAKRIELSDEERATLRVWASSGTTQQRMAVRARVVLAAEEGLPLAEISRRTGLSVNNCLKWRKRFVQERLEGLADKPGRGPASHHPGATT